MSSRTYHPTLEEALKANLTPRSHWPKIIEVVGALGGREIWTTASGSYVAVARHGVIEIWLYRHRICWADREEMYVFPDAPEAGGGGRSRSVERERGYCPQHRMELSTTGVCALCDW